MKIYYVYGKDNILFYFVIWLVVLFGIGEEVILCYIVLNEYLIVEKRKLFISKNWVVWVFDILECYDLDFICYFLIVNVLENCDIDFLWWEFIYSYNSELLGVYGNFVNWILKFIEKYYGGIVLK